MLDYSYFVYHDGIFEPMHLLSLFHDAQDQKYIDKKLWSGRLATGIFGSVKCDAGRRGPSGYNEVLLAIGDEGLQKLIELGFLACPVCHPECEDGFWDVAEDSIRKCAGANSLEAFLREPYDARRLDWEAIVSTIEAVPQRLYVPKDVSINELSSEKRRFENLGYGVPKIGFYDSSVPERFTEF